MGNEKVYQCQSDFVKMHLKDVEEYLFSINQV